MSYSESFLPKLIKISLLSGILFFLCITHSLLRNLKDVVVLSSVGVEAIPFLKTWIMLPTSCLAASCYTKIAHRYSARGSFIPLVISFLAYFLCFSFLLYPAREALALNSLSSSIAMWLPKSLFAIAHMVERWNEVLFYLMAELWSVLIISVAFWSVANDVVESPFARNSYGFLNLSSTVAPICAGLVVHPFLSFSWESSLKSFSLLIAVFCGLIILFFHFLEKYFPNQRAITLSVPPSLWESLQTVLRSPSLSAVAAMVFCHGITISVSDVLWKKQLSIRFPAEKDLFSHTSAVTVWTGCLASFGSFLVPLSKMSLASFSLLTPCLLFFFSLAFCLCSLPNSFDQNALQLSVLVGSANHALSKGLKYSLIDICKELVMVSAPPPLRLRGKAIIDGICGEAGKTIGSLFCQAMLLCFGHLSFLSSMFFLICVFLFWFLSSKSLRNSF